jgi:hypothetical protein
MNPTNRFRDENLKLTDFFDEVWVVCVACEKKAIAKTNEETKTARMFCVNCGYNKEVTTKIGKNGYLSIAANSWFEADLWLSAPFKNEQFWAYNAEHLSYLERYISADLREQHKRSHFTLLEKLPKFYHEAKNREGLLKIIEKLKGKR